MSWSWWRGCPLEDRAPAPSTNGVPFARKPPYRPFSHLTQQTVLCNSSTCFWVPGDSFKPALGLQRTDLPTEKGKPVRFEPVEQAPSVQIDHLFSQGGGQRLFRPFPGGPRAQSARGFASLPLCLAYPFRRGECGPRASPDLILRGPFELKSSQNLSSRPHSSRFRCAQVL